jgi:cell division septation protein DedD
VGKKIYNYSDDSPRFDDGEALLGVKANAYIKPQVSVQLAAEASKENSMLKRGEPNAWTDLERGMLNLQYDIPTRSKITPYVLGGLGYERLHKSEASTNVDSQAFYNAGAGLRYSVNNRVDLVAETRVIHKVEDQDTDIIGTVGVGMKFGNERKALSLTDLKNRTPKVEPVVASPIVAPKVEPEPVAPVVEPAAEIVDTRIEYDSGVVDMCEDSAVSVDDSCPAGRNLSADVEGYYVQVIALRKNSPDVIASRLDAKGYNYTLKEDGSLTRVLVGPYENRAAAASALRGLKKIRRDAFIYHAK